CPAAHVVRNTASRVVQIASRGRCASSSKQHAGTSALMWPRLGCGVSDSAVEIQAEHELLAAMPDVIGEAGSLASIPYA
ncbi:hypothetical protein NUV26_23535, partial [Burkholderia pseudomultivorans]|uniref:hypothetical protein n=1 Tax=Burkholderia pseudomultivorans TaxID=1207504 RepID=UPI0028740331